MAMTSRFAWLACGVALAGVLLTGCRGKTAPLPPKVTPEPAVQAAPPLKPLTADERQRLLVALASSDAKDRQAAAVALGEHREHSAVRPLIAALTDAEPAVRCEAARALGLIGGRDPTIPLADRLRKDTSPEVRAAAAVAVAHIASRLAIEPLVAGLLDSSPQVRLASAEGLGAMGPRLATGTYGELGRNKAGNALIAALDDEDVKIRTAAATALGAMKESRAVQPLAEMVCDPAGRLAAIASLGRIGSLNAAVALRQIAATDPDPAVRRAARQAMPAGR